MSTHFSTEYLTFPDGSGEVYQMYFRRTTNPEGQLAHADSARNKQPRAAFFGYSANSVDLSIFITDGIRIKPEQPELAAVSVP